MADHPDKRFLTLGPKPIGDARFTNMTVPKDASADVRSRVARGYCVPCIPRHQHNCPIIAGCPCCDKAAEEMGTRE